MAEKYVFHYFKPTRGRGEFIRYIFAYANVPYENHLITYDQWPTERLKMPFRTVPVLEVNGKMLAQSTAISKYLADKYGLAGKDEWTRAYADMLVHSIEDIYANYRPYIVGVLTKNEEAKEAALKGLLETFTALFERYENMLGNNEYFAGNQLTYADLAIAELSDRIEKCFAKNFMDSYPNVKAHMNRIHELPAIKKYIEKRPEHFY